MSEYSKCICQFTQFKMNQEDVCTRYNPLNFFIFSNTFDSNFEINSSEYFHLIHSAADHRPKYHTSKTLSGVHSCVQLPTHTSGSPCRYMHGQYRFSCLDLGVRLLQLKSILKLISK